MRRSGPRVTLQERDGGPAPAPAPRRPRAAAVRARGRRRTARRQLAAGPAAGDLRGQGKAGP